MPPLAKPQRLAQDKEADMYDFENVDFEELINQDTAVLEAMAKVDRGLFDAPEGRDEDLDALYEN